MRNLFRNIAIFLGIFGFSLLIFISILSLNIANSYKVNKNISEFNINSIAQVSAKISEKEESLPADILTINKNNNQKATVMLCNIIPIKEINLEPTEDSYVVPNGTPFGVKIFAMGALIIGFSEVDTDNNSKNPAQEAGLIKGDIILNISGKKIENNDDIREIMEKNNGENININFMRNSETKSLNVVPVKSQKDGGFKLGIWVRDSSAGIGTMTFFDPKTKKFGGLGHGICDIDTGDLFKLAYGDVVKASINGIKKGAKGLPGELKGYFMNFDSIGTITENSSCGIYGELFEPYPEGEKMKVALKQEIKTGQAQILSTIEGTAPKVYQINIESVNQSDDLDSKNMIIKITDTELLEKTGGIVQGMSGSPIIQDGMFVGAVTHVFINDPKKGYAIFAENMISCMNKEQPTLLPKIA